MSYKELIAAKFQEIQDSICLALEKCDGKARFQEDQWTRPEGGGGKSRIILNGNVFEKGGVNFSAVHGETPDKILNALKLDKADFFASGVSIVIHPKNPFTPIIHMNIRYFEMTNGVWWFGGGIDLTPAYLFEEDATYFHQELANVCNAHQQSYEIYKQIADDYFYIPHRNETRGIGGIFFDHLNEKSGKSKAEIEAFVLAVGNTFAKTYTTIVNKRKELSYTEENKNWQKIRRGRYVEFNLVYDKGTKFGLDTNGRTESILMSMPPEAIWEYNQQPAKNSFEEKSLQYFKKGIKWI